MVSSLFLFPWLLHDFGDLGRGRGYHVSRGLSWVTRFSVILRPAESHDIRTAVSIQGVRPSGGRSLMGNLVKARPWGCRLQDLGLFLSVISHGLSQFFPSSYREPLTAWMVVCVLTSQCILIWAFLSVDCSEGDSSLSCIVSLISIMLACTDWVLMNATQSRPRKIVFPQLPRQLCTISWYKTSE